MPSLQEIRNTISTSRKRDWNVVGCWGSGTGPSYLNSFATYHSGTQPGDWLGMEIESHAAVASHCEDVSLTIAWGMDSDRGRELSFPWQHRFADQEVTRQFVDIFWCGSLIDRESLLVVDGGRAYLPSGRSRFEKDDSSATGYGEWLTDEVTTWQYELARVANELEHLDEYESYFDRAGFTVLT